MDSKKIPLFEGPLKIIEKVGASITKKIPQRDEFEFLTDGEKVFVYIDIFEKEMKNGGFDQFFINPSGQFTHEILAAYESIHAHKTADILYRAILLFPEVPVPKSNMLRSYFLDRLSSENQELLSALDTEFYKADEDIVELLSAYILTHISQFEF